MTTELQDLAWSCLPKEFKEEVKKMWQSADKEQQLPHDAFLRGEYSILFSLFGHHNLTSDAEGEEMLMVSRKEIQQLVAANDTAILKSAGIDSIETIQAKTVNTILNRLFGSKCLPDEEPKPAEPKESPRQFYRVMGTDEHGRQVVIPIPPQLARPYDISKERTEPEESTCTETCTEDCSSQCKSQDFDNGFAKERRLNIATQMASAYISSEGMTDPSLIATIAFQLADALIAECELTDKLKGE